MSELFLNSLQYWSALRILNRPRGHVKILTREHVQEFGLYRQSVFPEILYLLVQPDFLLKDRLGCPRSFKLNDEIIFLVVQLMPIPDYSVRLVAIKRVGCGRICYQYIILVPERKIQAAQRVDQPELVREVLNRLPSDGRVSLIAESLSAFLCHLPERVAVAFVPEITVLPHRHDQAVFFKLFTRIIPIK